MYILKAFLVLNWSWPAGQKKIDLLSWLLFSPDLETLNPFQAGPVYFFFFFTNSAYETAHTFATAYFSDIRCVTCQNNVRVGGSGIFFMQINYTSLAS